MTEVWDKSSLPEVKSMESGISSDTQVVEGGTGLDIHHNAKDIECGN